MDAYEYKDAIEICLQTCADEALMSLRNSLTFLEAGTMAGLCLVTLLFLPLPRTSRSFSIVLLDDKTEWFAS